MTENAKAPVFERPIDGRGLKPKHDPRACGDGEGGGTGGGDPGTGSLLDAGGGAGSEGGAAGAGGSGDDLAIPEKFLVKNEGGEVDHKGILRKFLPSYISLEKRIGSGDIPPKAADEYKLEKYLPDGYDENPEAMKPVLGEFHKLGLTNKQAQGVMSVFGNTLAAGLAQEKASLEKTQETLKGEWGKDYEKNVGLANRALALLASDAERKALAQPKYGTDPLIMRLLAKVGMELSDDRLPSDLNAGEIDDIEQLRTSDAYRDPKHADHKRVVARVNEAYQRGFKAKT